MILVEKLSHEISFSGVYTVMNSDDSKVSGVT